MNRLYLRILLVILMLTTALPALAQDTKLTPTPVPTTDVKPNTENPQADMSEPRFILTEYDPWRMVIGSDGPAFVAYDNGLVIFQRPAENVMMEYAAVTLSPDELDALLMSMVSPDFFTLEPYYDTVMITDQPTSNIRVSDDEHGTYEVGVYGDLCCADEARNLTPQAYLDAYDAAMVYDNPNAQTWLPEMFEVMVWPFETSGALPWPEEWPGINDPMTVERDGLYSIYLDMDEYGRYQSLAESASAFLIDGQTFTFSVRYPFPHELSD